MARRRGTFPTRGGNRRLTEWSTFDDGGYTVVTAGGATILSGIAFEDPGTIVRTRGVISIKPAAFSADVNIFGAFGIGLVSAEAFAAGIASVPEPFSDADWGGWMVLQPFTMNFEVTTDVGRLLGSMQMVIDSKAMRKVEPSSVMVAVVESAPASAAFEFADLTRLLQKLH